jgi:hypothetical protein
MAKVFRIVAARTQRPGEFDAPVAAGIPSPKPSEMQEALADPIAHRHRTITHERDVVQQRPAPKATPHTGGPTAPDLTTEVKKQRGA